MSFEKRHNNNVMIREVAYVTSSSLFKTMPDIYEEITIDPDWTFGDNDMSMVLLARLSEEIAYHLGDEASDRFDRFCQENGLNKTLMVDFEN